MIRLLTAVLLLTYSLFGWSSAYPDDYGSMVIHKNGDIIDAKEINNNNNIHKQNIIELNNNIVDLQESISTIEAGTGPQGPQGPQGEQGPAGERLASRPALAAVLISSSNTMVQSGCALLLPVRQDQRRRSSSIR